MPTRDELERWLNALHYREWVLTLPSIGPLRTEGEPQGDYVCLSCGANRELGHIGYEGPAGPRGGYETVRPCLRPGHDPSCVLAHTIQKIEMMLADMTGSPSAAPQEETP